MSAADRASHRAHPRAQWRRAVQGTIRLTAALALIGSVSAQTPAPTAPAPTPPTTAVTAGWNEGFFIQTPNGDNRLQIGFVAQADGRFALDDPLPITNTFVMRKVRPTFTGRVAKYIDFKIMPELAGSVVLLDGYFDIRFSPQLRLRSGKDKTPVGYELLLSDASLDLPRTLGGLLARAEPRRRVPGTRRSRRWQAALLRWHLQRQPARRHERHHGRRHEQRQGSRWACRVDALPVGADAAARAQQLRRPSRWVERNADGRAAVVQNLGRPDLLRLPGNDDGRRSTEPGNARGLPLSQELRRLRRVRPHRRSTS